MNSHENSKTPMNQSDDNQIKALNLKKGAKIKPDKGGSNRIKPDKTWEGGYQVNSIRGAPGNYKLPRNCN
jgi:hypothetical protein